MADKSTTIPIGICENIPVQVANNCLILTDFVALEMPEDDNMSVILGRHFLNTTGAVIDCNQGKVTFNVNDKEHMVYFPKKIDRKYALNSKRMLRPSELVKFIVQSQSPKKNIKLLWLGLCLLRSR
jgi:hypothetical protein